MKGTNTAPLVCRLLSPGQADVLHRRAGRSSGRERGFPLVSDQRLLPQGKCLHSDAESLPCVPHIVAGEATIDLDRRPLLVTRPCTEDEAADQHQQSANEGRIDAVTNGGRARP